MPDAILALDLATHLGWAAWRRDAQRVRYGSHQLPKGSRDIGPFLAAYNVWLRKALKHVQPDAVCFELPFIGGKSSQAQALKLMTLAGMTEWICFDWGLDPKMIHSINTGTMTKHFTGKGGGTRDDKKARVIHRCKQLGWHPANDDEADALGLLDYYLNWWKIVVPVAGPLFRPEPPATILAAG